MEADAHAEISTRLHRTGQRYTGGRRQLVDLLATAGRPLSIPEVLDAGADLSQSSVYRNLTTLEGCGVVRRLASSDDSARFELDEDLTGHHHHHLVCSSCGNVADVELSRRIERVLDRAVDEARDAHGFHAASHHVELVGLCATCA